MISKNNELSILGAAATLADEDGLVILNSVAKYILGIRNLQQSIAATARRIGTLGEWLIHECGPATEDANDFRADMVSALENLSPLMGPSLTVWTWRLKIEQKLGGHNPDQGFTISLHHQYCYCSMCTINQHTGEQGYILCQTGRINW